jgi:hypothetical protein
LIIPKTGKIPIVVKTQILVARFQSSSQKKKSKKMLIASAITQITKTCPKC